MDRYQADGVHHPRSQHTGAAGAPAHFTTNGRATKTQNPRPMRALSTRPLQREADLGLVAPSRGVRRHPRVPQPNGNSVPYLQS